MRIDRALNLVIPVVQEERTIYVHSTAISTEVYDIYWRVLARTFADINTQGLGAMGPQIAAKMLREVADEMGVWADEPRAKRVGVERGLLAEIRRLTNVLVCVDKGWEMIPIEDARKAGHLDDEDVKEIEGRLVFFTAGSHLFPKANRRGLLAGSLSLWGAQIESLDCTEFMRSLMTSTGAASTGETAV